MTPLSRPLDRRARDAEATLVADVARGDISGLGILFDRYGDDVRRLLLRLGAPAAEVDDLVQQTFLDVLRAAERFQPGAPVRPWLFGLAAMVARRHRRTLARMVARLKSFTLARTTTPVPTPSEEASRKEEAGRALAALHALSDKKREAFVLVALEGMSGEEAAAALAIPIATVWTRLHHARRELKEALLAKEPS
jgi:RNA polymerase sigma-70 factor (ECF subfamily)